MSIDSWFVSRVSSIHLSHYLSYPIHSFVYLELMLCIYTPLLHTHIHTIVDIHRGKERERAVILERLWVLSLVGLRLEGVCGEECMYECECWCLIVGLSWGEEDR